mgnify:CR=1 FL=1
MTSNNGIGKFRLIIEFDALRIRFDDDLYPRLWVWDEFLRKNIKITSGNEPSDLTRPGEGLVKIYWQDRDEDDKRKK